MSGCSRSNYLSHDWTERLRSVNCLSSCKAADCGPPRWPILWEGGFPAVSYHTPNFFTSFADPGRYCLHPGSRWSNKWSSLKCAPQYNWMWGSPKTVAIKGFWTLFVQRFKIKCVKNKRYYWSVLCGICGCGSEPTTCTLCTVHIVTLLNDNNLPETPTLRLEMPTVYDCSISTVHTKLSALIEA